MSFRFNFVRGKVRVFRQVLKFENKRKIEKKNVIFGANKNPFLLLAIKELELLVIHDSITQYKIYIRKLIAKTV